MSETLTYMKQVSSNDRKHNSHGYSTIHTHARNWCLSLSVAMNDRCMDWGWERKDDVCVQISDCQIDDEQKIEWVSFCGVQSIQFRNNGFVCFWKLKHENDYMIITKHGVCQSRSLFSFFFIRSFSFFHLLPCISIHSFFTLLHVRLIYVLIRFERKYVLNMKAMLSFLKREVYPFFSTAFTRKNVNDQNVFLFQTWCCDFIYLINICIYTFSTTTSRSFFGW